MSGERSRGSRHDELSRLLLEVLRQERPESEWIARYARDPESLSREQRAEVEAYLAEAPHHGDAIRVVQSFAYRRSGTERDEAKTPDRSPRVPRRTLARPVWLAAGVGALGAAAWAMLAFVSPRAVSDRDALDVPPVAVERAQRASAGDPPRDDAIARGDRIEAARSPSESAATPSPPAGPLSSATPEGVAPVESGPAPTRPLAAFEESPIAEAAEPPPSALMARVRMPEYERPAGSPERPRVAATVRSGTASPIELTALAPDHVALTTRERPILLWSLAGAGSTEGTFGLVLFEPDAAAPIFDGVLETPAGEGLQRIDLAALDVALPADAEVVWSVVFSLDPGDPSRDRVATGWIRRRSAAQTGASDATPIHERAATYAREGLWYDALAVLDDLRRAHPGDPSVRAAFESLLRQGGVRGVSVPGD